MVNDSEDVKTFHIDCEFLDNLFHMKEESELTDEQIVQQMAVDALIDDDDLNATKAREMLEHVDRLETFFRESNFMPCIIPTEDTSAEPSGSNLRNRLTEEPPASAICSCTSDSADYSPICE